ncbi:MAG: LamG-like jellyroll fold domain-containing protein, partial [Planctomycetota bacterium]
MCKRFIFLLLVVAFGLSSSVHAVSIIWVSDNKTPTGGVAADQAWVDLLRAEGYAVDYKGEDGVTNFRHWRTLDAGKIAELNAADLIIVSRDTDSGSYANGTEPTDWNGVTTPLILQAAHIVRSNRWVWLNTTGTNNSQSTLQAVDSGHLIFNGVPLDGSNQVDILTAVSAFGSTADAGNGTLIAKRADNDQVWIVEWEEGQEFYTGSGQTAGGHRMYFASGGVGPDGGYNLTAAGETLFLNAVAYMGGPVTTASNPNPADGSTIDGYLFQDNIYVVLTFDAGDDAQQHEVFFSEFENLVTARDPCVSLGAAPDPLKPTEYYAGIPLPEWTPYNDSLVRGTTYYWCADEADSNGVIWQGPVWSFYVALEEASNPNPADYMINVSYTPTLSWGAGVTEGYSAPHEHEIYFGTDYNDVNNATDTSPLYRGSNAWTDLDWEPNSDGGLPALDPNTDYYWRIDEAHGSFIVEVLKGPVWTFRTIPEFPIDDPNFLAWWRLDEEKGDTALDHSGHGNHGTLNGDPERVGGMIGNALELDGTGDYIAIQNLYYAGPNYPEVTVCGWIRTSNSGDQVIASFDRNEYWRLEINGNGAGPGQVGWDVLTATGQVDYGSNTRVDDGQWHHVAGVFDNGTLIIYIDGSPEPSASGGSTFGTATTRYGFLGVGSEASVFDGSKGPTNYFNGDMDDFRIYADALTASEIVRAASPPEAWSPNPYDGALIDPADYVQFEVTWKSGADAAQHEVYWGTSPASLALVATKPRSEPNYAPDGGIEFGETYYWQIVETNNPSWPGPIWSFSTVREAGMGSIVVERWENLQDLAVGNSIDDLKNDLRFPDNPDETYEVTRFHSGTGLGDNYGGRVHGWLIPETTGNYRFLLATDDPGELWLSYSSDPFAAERIAWIGNPAFPDSPRDGYSGEYQWFKYPTQDSNNVVGPIFLEADQKYYISALWKEASGGDHGVVAWEGPDQPVAPVSGSGDAVIDGYYLMPFTRLWA